MAATSPLEDIVRFGSVTKPMPLFIAAMENSNRVFLQSFEMGSFVFEVGKLRRCSCKLSVIS